MIKVVYKPQFIRQFRKFPLDIQDEITRKIDLFRDPRNHRMLKVHKLHGPLSGRSSFSVDFRHRIVFRYVSKDEVVLLVVGDHAIYR